MKRIFMAFILVCSFILTACSATSIGVIGGVDGPTAILVSDDEWGLTLLADDVTNTGMTLKIKQFGGIQQVSLTQANGMNLKKWKIIVGRRFPQTV